MQFDDDQYYNDIGVYFVQDSSIIFFESLEQFKSNVSCMHWIPYNQPRQHHLVYVPGLTLSVINETFVDGFHIDHVNFLVNETEKSIELVTGYMFTKDACREYQLKTINRFDADARKWENSVFYPQKYQNFHGCELSIAKVDENQSKDKSALIESIFETVLNAKLVDGDPEEKGLLGIHSDLIREQHEISDDAYSFDVANPHVIEIHTFAVPPGEPYTDLERMFMMFSVELWIAIGVTLLIGILVTLSLSFVSDVVRKFIAGRDIKSPTMNLVSIFLTGGQVKTPGRNFARFLFTLFVIWSLIIRTCHQSMLFELMQADLRRPPIKSLDKLFESDLTLHYYKSWENFTSENKNFFVERMTMTSTRLVRCNEIPMKTL